ncbi:hypothetical protein LCGC14_0610560 [marine sediment metagenome]|uniref:Uncharacterized protein n=1 Tax=marine sediment metagenome TaxID=412755 RepID=A0A0F9RS32_9ZZZZ
MVILEIVQWYIWGVMGLVGIASMGIACLVVYLIYRLDIGGKG